MMQIKLKTGPWKLEDLANVEKHGLKVFSCFSCGGGSTMGYKLAGYDVIGCCEIDPEMMEVYRKHFNPEYHYLMGVQQFKRIPDSELPDELFELDILDGSPPCSSFSTAGSREKKWGKASKFREGQAIQHLDDLFFDFIDIAEKLKPKVVIAENVKGLIQGNAKGYVKQIFQRFKKAGYSVQLFLLNASRMGVPQRRERTFFIANRLDKRIRLDFGEDSIYFKKIQSNIMDNRKNVCKSLIGAGKWCFQNKTSEVVNWSKYKFGKEKFFTMKTSLPDEVLKTQRATSRHIRHDTDFYLSDDEVRLAQTFPIDYHYKDIGYLCGMSVPPFMMQRVAAQVYKQFFDESCEVING